MIPNAHNAHLNQYVRNVSRDTFCIMTLAFRLVHNSITKRYLIEVVKFVKQIVQYVQGVPQTVHNVKPICF